MTQRRAWTLIETLVTIGVIGILLSIIVPTIRSARERAGETTSVARIGQCGVMIAGWAMEHDDHYPAARPGVLYPGPPMASLSGQDELFRWFTAQLWAALILGPTGLLEQAPALMSPGVRDEAADERVAAGLPSYFFCNSFVADPRLWTEGTSAVMDGAASPLLRYVRIGEVTFPSQKAMLHDWDMAYLARKPRTSVHGLRDARTPIAFADGHGAALEPADAAAPFPNPLNVQWYGRAALHNTPGGVHGIDFK